MAFWKDSGVDFVAVSIGTGVGTNALLARLLGLGDKDRADAAVGNAQFLALVISAVFMLFSAVGVVPYVNSQSAGGSISGEAMLCPSMPKSSTTSSKTRSVPFSSTVALMPAISSGSSTVIVSASCVEA